MPSELDDLESGPFERIADAVESQEALLQSIQAETEAIKLRLRRFSLLDWFLVGAISWFWFGVCANVIRSYTGAGTAKVQKVAAVEGGYMNREKVWMDDGTVWVTFTESAMIAGDKIRYQYTGESRFGFTGNADCELIDLSRSGAAMSAARIVGPEKTSCPAK